MRYQAILFDMDGTLLPMDTEAFAKLYFKALAAELAPYGVAPDAMFKPFWAATTAMMKNDGSQLNSDAFWSVFCAQTSADRAVLEPVCDTFYANGFQVARQATAANPLAQEAVRTAHAKADQVILATNPLFPMQAQQARMGWIGLQESDFDLVTCYTSDRYCKPNPAYYQSICDRMGLDPRRCLMIGNDDREDMYAAQALGMDCYLITDCRLPLAENPWNGPQGTFQQMLEMLQAL